MLLELLSLQLQCYQSFPSLPGSLSLLAPHQEQRVRACACLLFYGKYDWALRVIRLCNLNQVEVFVQAASLIASKTQKIQRVGLLLAHRNTTGVLPPPWAVRTRTYTRTVRSGLVFVATQTRVQVCLLFRSGTPSLMLPGPCSGT